MNKKILITASVLGLIGIVLGAFATHGLKKVIDAEAMDSFQVGLRYQMYHAIVLLWVGSSSLLSVKTKRLLFYFALTGVVLFSGSIYSLSTNDLTGFDFVRIAFITPVGGLLLIIFWVVLLTGFIRLKSDKL
jgi:uncharacterized membrane protein YgdD (TMEM256/DUF423 family)